MATTRRLWTFSTKSISCRDTKYYPGFIGGHCVIPNIQLLRTIQSSPLLEAVLESNRLRAEELADEAKTTAPERAHPEPDPAANECRVRSDTEAPAERSSSSSQEK